MSNILFSWLRNIGNNLILLSISSSRNNLLWLSIMSRRRSWLGLGRGVRLMIINWLRWKGSWGNFHPNLETTLYLKTKSQASYCSKHKMPSYCWIKSSATLIELGDDNTNFFDSYENHQRIVNTIWELKYERGISIKGFKGFLELGVHFSQKLLYKTRGSESG